MNIENTILLKERHEYGIIRLVLNDSKRKNALSNEMIDSIKNEISKISDDKSCRIY